MLIHVLDFGLRAVKDKTKPDKAHIHTREDAAMLKSFESFKIIRGLLYRQVISKSEMKNQLVLPFCKNFSIIFSTPPPTERERERERERKRTAYCACEKN